MSKTFTSVQTFLRGWRLLSPYPRGLAAVLGLSLLGTALGLLSSCTQKILVDDVLTGRLPELLWALQAIFLCAVLAESGLMILKRRLTASMSIKAAQGIRRKLVDRLLRMDYQVLQSAKEADMITDLQYGVDSLSDMLMDGVPMLIPSVISVALCLGAMAVIDWRLTLLSLPVYPLMVLVTRAVNRRIYARHKKSQGLRADMMGIVNESLNAAVMVRNPGCPERILQEFDATQDKLRQNSVRLYMIYELLSRASWALIMVPYQAILYGVGGGWLLASGTPTLGTILIFANLTNYLIGPVMSLVNMGSHISEAQAGFERIDRFLALKQAQKPAFVPCQGAAAQLRQVGFRYEEGGAWSIKGLSATIPQGETTILWGPSGSGKSTLLKLLSGLLPVPTSGEVARNGQLTWRYFPQSPVLFNRTIAQNFQLLRPETTREEMYHCLALTGMEETVRQKPQGLDQPLNRTEDSFSGGEYRRLSLAIFLSLPGDVWLLDEPTASLDRESALGILHTLEKLQAQGKTLVIATHDELLKQLKGQTIAIHADKATYGNVMRLHYTRVSDQRWGV